MCMFHVGYKFSIFSFQPPLACGSWCCIINCVVNNFICEICVEFFSCFIYEPLICTSWVHTGNTNHNHTKCLQARWILPIMCFNYALQLQVVLMFIIMLENICTDIEVWLHQPRLINLKTTFSTSASGVSGTCLQFSPYIFHHTQLLLHLKWNTSDPCHTTWLKADLKLLHQDPSVILIPICLL